MLYRCKDVCQEQTLRCSHLQLVQSNAAIDCCNSGAEATDLPSTAHDQYVLQAGMLRTSPPTSSQRRTIGDAGEMQSSVVLYFVAERLRLLQSTESLIFENAVRSCISRGVSG